MGRKKVEESSNEASFDIENQATSMGNQLTNLHALSPACRIYRVPERLRNVKQKAYTPQVVSVRPRQWAGPGAQTGELSIIELGTDPGFQNRGLGTFGRGWGLEASARVSWGALVLFGAGSWALKADSESLGLRPSVFEVQLGLLLRLAESRITLSWAVVEGGFSVLSV
ncbi:hypothetical protein L3X38_045490 [Prunus dulcis]|uniref:Uncharacterized protein n=1 Tax=Prunus dulcis TaxID=3755 RepID=A0AAD4YJ45_PRUDU|nr:hypothetical protein L3X38_045490 [Prunus dulcis]